MAMKPTRVTTTAGPRTTTVSGPRTTTVTGPRAGKMMQQMQQDAKQPQPTRSGRSTLYQK
jgi:hypothetical protein